MGWCGLRPPRYGPLEALPLLLLHGGRSGERSCMGTWGTGIFDDDTACDVRGHYRRALRAGVPGPEATDQLLRAYAPGPDPFDTPIWLGLAATQTKLGRLEERVKTTALE